MSKNRFELNRAGVRALLQSQEVMDACAGEAQAILGRLGDGYEMDTYTGKNRVNAMVWAESYQAKRDNMENNTLLKAAGSS